MLALRKPALVIKYIYFTRKAFTESFEGVFFNSNTNEDEVIVFDTS